MRTGDGLVLVAGGGAPEAGRRRGEEEPKAGRGLREANELGLEGLLPSIQIGPRRCEDEGGAGGFCKKNATSAADMQAPPVRYTVNTRLYAV